MAYPINPDVQEQNQIRFHSAERHYIEQLAQRGGVIRLDNVAVDAEQLVLRPFQCDSRWCLRQVSEKGSKKFKGSCCTDLEVDVTPAEVERLRELGRLAVERLEFTPRDPAGEIARRMAAGRFTEITDAGETAFSHLPSGRCPLGWIPREGGIRCGINSLCWSLKLPLTQYKPEPCFMFPLHFVEYGPGQFLLTVICKETHMAVGADAYVTRVRCLRNPQAVAPPAFLSLRHEIILCFGEAFYRELAAAALPYLDRAGLSEHARALADELAGGAPEAAAP